LVLLALSFEKIDQLADDSLVGRLRLLNFLAVDLDICYFYLLVIFLLIAAIGEIFIRIGGAAWRAPLVEIFKVLAGPRLLDELRLWDLEI
jgi:hypothetical protein